MDLTEASQWARKASQFCLDDAPVATDGQPQNDAPGVALNPQQFPVSFSNQAFEKGT